MNKIADEEITEYIKKYQEHLMTFSHDLTKIIIEVHNEGILGHMVIVGCVHDVLFDYMMQQRERGISIAKKKEDDEKGVFV